MVKILSARDINENILEQLRHVFLRSHNANVFQNPDYLLLVSKHYKLKTTIAIYESEDKITAYCFLFNEGEKVFKRYLSPYQPSLCSYGGIISLTNNAEDVKELLKRIERLNFIQSLYFKIGPNIDISPYKARKFAISEIPTLLIDLSRGEEEVWNGVENRIRRNIKKAISNNIIVTSDRGEKIEALSNIYRNLTSRKGLNYHDTEFYRESFRILNHDGKSRVFYAEIQGEIISGMTVLVYKNTINPWFGGTLTDYVNTGAGSLVYWEIMKYGITIGCKQYDFLGLDIEPIAFYKRGFGGFDVPVFHAGKKSLPFKYLNRAKKCLKLKG